MSTYYKFNCKKCGESGGFISRQAWGWGNFDIIDSFKFIAHHISECGEESICVVSEHDDEYHGNQYEKDYLDHGFNYAEDRDDERRLKFLEETSHIFPISNDWRFMNENKEGFRDKWIENEKKEIGK